MKHVTVWIGAVCVASLSVTAFAQQKMASGSNMLSDQDKQFLTAAGQGQISEITLGRLAQQRGGSAGKMFGMHMVKDHTKADKQLMQVGKKTGFTIPQSMEPDAKSLQTQLSGLTGSEFDRSYISHMVDDHKKDIAEFEKEAQSGQNPTVKSFASKSLPILRSHLKMAQGLMAKQGGNKMTSMKMNSKSSGTKTQ